LERYIFDQDLTKFGIRGQQFPDARTVAGLDSLPELTSEFDGEILSSGEDTTSAP